MSAREDIAALLFTTDNSKAVAPWSEWEHSKNEPRLTEYVYAMADALIAAGYRKPRTITTAEELDALPYATTVMHDEGWGVTVAERHAEDMRWYVTGCLEYIRPEALLPATVLYETGATR